MIKSWYYHDIALTFVPVIDNENKNINGIRN